jgi:hypothetical protein
MTRALCFAAGIVLALTGCAPKPAPEPVAYVPPPPGPQLIQVPPAAPLPENLSPPVRERAARAKPRRAHRRHIYKVRVDGPARVQRRTRVHGLHGPVYRSTSP